MLFRSYGILPAHLKNSVRDERGEDKDAKCPDRVRAHFDHPERDEEHDRDETGGPAPETPPEWRRRDEAREVEDDRENKK